MNNLRRKYRPNLVGLMNLGETNYMLVLRLLADKEKVGEVREFFINEHLSYQLVVKEVTRYTSLIDIAQDAVETTSDMAELIRPQMQLRLYHDAKMVEIISTQNIRQVKPRYEYPNDKMHQPDEKQQALVFLKEWLQMCLQYGQVNINLQHDHSS